MAASRVRRCLAALAATAVLLPALGGAASGTAAGAGAGQGGHLELVQWQFPEFLNPYVAFGVSNSLAASLALEPLAEVAPDGTLVPALATEIPTQDNDGISDDGTEVTWTLRDDVYWSDGTPFTADDVVFTWEYCRDLGFFCLSGGLAFGVADVVADDPHTVTITFLGSEPDPFFVFVGYQSPVLQKAQFFDCLGEDPFTEACEANSRFPIGTGPFAVTSFVEEQAVNYSANPNYRGAADGEPFFGSVRIAGVDEPQAAAEAVLVDGTADVGWNIQVAPDILDLLLANGLGRAEVGFTSAVEHVNLNQTEPGGVPPAGPNPFFVDNPVLHEALSLAIDRPQVVAVGYGLTGRPTCNMWNVGSATSTNNDSCLTQDLATANQLLDDLGWVDTDDDGIRETDEGAPLVFELVTSDNPVRQATQELLQFDWASIGVDVVMTSVPACRLFNPFAHLEDDPQPGDECTGPDVSIWRFPTDMQMFSNGSGSPNPLDYLSAWTTEEIPVYNGEFPEFIGNNIPRLANATYDDLIDQLAVTPLADPGRDGLTIQLNDILSTTAVIPLVERGSVSVYGSDIEGVGTLNGWDSEWWNIEKWRRAPTEVEIKIKPKRITLEYDDGMWTVERPRRLRVIVFSTADFDATTIDPTTASLGDPELSGAVTALRSRIADKNRDGLPDVVLRFRTADLLAADGLAASTTELALSASRAEGPVVGTDGIRIRVDD